MSQLDPLLAVCGQSMGSSIVHFALTQRAREVRVHWVVSSS
jgi:hypothetical protein